MSSVFQQKSFQEITLQQHQRIWKQLVSTLQKQRIKLCLKTSNTGCCKAIQLNPVLFTIIASGTLIELEGQSRETKAVMAMKGKSRGTRSEARPSVALRFLFSLVLLFIELQTSFCSLASFLAQPKHIFQIFQSFL